MSKTVLVVDDSASMRQVVSIALKSASFDVVEAASGEEALAFLDGRRVNLIISDVNMPGIDGITLVKEVKKRPAYKFTPVMMLTTESQPDAIERGRQAGAKAWMIKPFKPEEMLNAISRIVTP
jgi:two-component system chemotaxis response regulator CheY